MSVAAAASRATFETYLVVSVAGERAKNLTADEIYCLRLLISTLDGRKSMLIYEWRMQLPLLGSDERDTVAFQGLVDKGIIETEPLPEDIRYMGGGSAVGLTSEIWNSL